MPLSIIARRLSRLPTKEGRQVLVAAGVLAWANVGLKLLPFRRAISMGSRRIRHGRRCNEAIADQWAIAVSRAARLVPWRSVCIHQGLTLQWLLRRRGIPAILIYGVQFEGGELAAHVWVKVGDRTIIGGEESGRFHKVASYPSEPTRF